MRCDEFERTLQQRLDREPSSYDDRALQQHAQRCESCREFQEGLSLLSQSFAHRHLPAPSESLTDRICHVAARPATRPYRQAFRWLVAACALAALGLSIRYVALTRTPVAQLVANRHTPNPMANEDALFPELIDPATMDSRDSIALAERVEPVSKLFRAFGRSLGAPVIPIAVSTSEAMSNLLKDVPDPDATMMPIPGMREMMGPAPKKQMTPSS